MNASRVWLLGAALAWIPCIAPAQVIRIAHTNTHRGFVQQLKLAAERCNVAISVEFVDTVVLNETILRRASANQCPDAVIISADNLAKEALAFSPISRELLSPDLSERTLALATQQGRIHGIPLICGNHLMLIYNKAKVAEPKRILEDFPAPTTEGRHAIVWNHAAMYYFWPFVLAFDGDPLGPDRLNMDNPGLRQALGAYVEAGRRLKLKTELDHSWSLNAFADGRADCLIDGDWSLGNLESILGSDNLGIDPLPSFGGRPLQSVASAFVLAFPNLNLANEKKAALQRLALTLQGPEFQTAVWREMRAIPVNEQVLLAVLASDDDLLKRSLACFRSAMPLSIDPRMPVVWETLEKGYARLAAGFYTSQVTSAYMQHLADKSLGATAP